MKGDQGVPRPDLLPESAYFLQANRNKRSYISTRLDSKCTLNVQLDPESEEQERAGGCSSSGDRSGYPSRKLVSLREMVG